MSRLPFELLLALRYLRPKRTFVSVITLISVLGVMLGVSVLIIVISVMSGFDKEMREKVLGFNAHLHVVPDGPALAQYESVSATIRSNAHVVGVAPYVLGQVLIETHPGEGRTSTFRGPFMRGVEPEAEAKVSSLTTNIIGGSFDLSGRGVLVGADLAGQLGLMIGDRITLYAPRDLKQMKEAHTGGEERMRIPDDYEVRGVFSSGWYEYDEIGRAHV